MGGKGELKTVKVTKIFQATMRHQGKPEGNSGNSGHSEFDRALIARLDAQACRIVPYIVSM